MLRASHSLIIRLLVVSVVFVVHTWPFKVIGVKTGNFSWGYDQLASVEERNH